MAIEQRDMRVDEILLHQEFTQLFRMLGEIRFRLAQFACERVPCAGFAVEPIELGGGFIKKEIRPLPAVHKLNAHRFGEKPQDRGATFARGAVSVRQPFPRARLFSRREDITRCAFVWRTGRQRCFVSE
ncbi:MAG TPA: hypothetical protein VGW39_14840 [Chthoniobacterales bacterium]|nr:hypothetical protein [Chthoniobacterales bacterium]